MGLSVYKKKRRFSETPEPEGKIKSSKNTLRFVVQKHHATQLHYDFRLEMEGVLKSWAVPKGPSLNPADKRLAMEVEDHPYDYRNFEGVIPEGNYGAGTVIVWDEGVYEPSEENLNKKEQEKMLLQQHASGNIKFVLHGEKLKGSFTLLRLKKGDGKSWLLIKKKDEFATEEDVTEKDTSVRSGKTIEEVALEKSKKKGKEVVPLNVANGTDQTLVVNGHDLLFTNLDKVYWKKEGITKGDMVNYYARVLPWLLPYMTGRPQSLHRYPNGIDGTSFFQKDVRGKVPDWMTTHEDFSESTGETVQYLVCSNEATLLYMANLGCIEMHPWHSRVQHPTLPDYCLIDLDPDRSNTFEQVMETARLVKDLLDDLKVPCYCKTSGSTGIHIYIPLGAQYNYDESKQLAELLVNIINKEMPDLTSVERNPEKRKGKIYLDFLQNRETQTVAAPYSLRPKPGMPVSAPLDWSELKKGLSPATYNINNILDRLKTDGDLFRPVLGKGINLERVLKKIGSLTF